MSTPTSSQRHAMYRFTPVVLVLLLISFAVAAQEPPPAEETPPPAEETPPADAAQEPPAPAEATPAGEPAPPAEASSQLAQILQGLSWGATHEEVLEFYRAQYLNDYRAEIAGMRDTLRIDEIRRAHNDRYARVEQSLEEFDGTRTGYEVSVLGGEMVAGNDESMLTVRTSNAQLYYLFASGLLFKIAVAYNASYLGNLEFDAFLEQVERRYGPPESTQMEETAAGIRYLARARWEDGDTRLRVENHSNLFGTFIMVFTNVELEDRVELLRGGSGTGAGVAVSDLVRGLSADRTTDEHSDIADQIIGAPTIVELVVPEAAPVDLTVVEETEAAAEEGDAEEEGEAEEEEETRTRRRRDREEEEEGITIY